MTVKLLTDHDLPFSQLVPGLDLARSITHAGTTQLGGGYMKFTEDAEFADWTLKYDEVLFVQSGELEIVSDGRSVKANEGQAILIPDGEKVTYRGKAGTVGFFVLWPFSPYMPVNGELNDSHSVPVPVCCARSMTEPSSATSSTACRG